MIKNKGKSTSIQLPKPLLALLTLALALNFIYMYVSNLKHDHLPMDALTAMHFRDLQTMRVNFALLGIVMAALILFVWIRYDLREKKVHERARLMLDATPLACSLWDRNFNIIDCNREALQLFGLANKKEFGDRFFELVPEYQPGGKPSREVAYEMIETALQNGYCRFECMHLSLRGERIPCEIIMVRVSYGGEQVVAAYVKDMREQLAADAKMREADERARLMLDAIPMSCSLWDRNHNILDCNQESMKLLGLLDKNEFKEKFHALSPEHQPCGRASREKAYEIVEKAFQDGYCRCEWMHRSLSGKLIPCRITLIRIGHRGSQIVAAYIKDLREYLGDMNIQSGQQAARVA